MWLSGDCENNPSSVCKGGGWCVWAILFERTQCSGQSDDFEHEQRTRVSRYDRIHCLHALDVEEFQCTWHGQFNGHKMSPSFYKPWPIIRHGFGMHFSDAWIMTSMCYTRWVSDKFPHYNMDYCLADGIYPKWTTIAKLIWSPQGKKELHFHNAQAAARKDVERDFDILQS
jgi:hypothetical protein